MGRPAGCRPARMFTEVLNLATGETLIYSLPPEEAVKAAYLQSLGDYNTWDYPKRKVPLVRGKKTVACGDFTALIGERSGEKNEIRQD